MLTSKVTFELSPSPLPRPLFSLAYAVNVCFPSGSALLSVLVDHFPPAAVVVADATSVDPSKTWTTTSVASLAVPENPGMILFDGVAGCTIVTTGGSVLTSKVTFALSPSALPRPLFSFATAVNVPVVSALLSVLVDHFPPDAVAFAVATSAAPSNTCTTTSVVSLAVPENDGSVLFDGVTGCASVTTGGSVLTSKVTFPLSPSPLPRPLFSLAYAVNVCFPSGSALLSVLVDHFPPAAVVVADATSVDPSKTWTTTSVASLAVPENPGMILFDGVAGCAIVTTGGSVLTSNVTFALSPSPLPRPLFSLAYAVNVCFPSGSALLSVLVDHFPPAAVVFTFATSSAPRNTCTSTSVASLAVPENPGMILFDGVAGCTIVTTGGSVLTSKVTFALSPSALPRPLFSFAIAVNVPVVSALLRVLVDHFPPDAVAFAVATSVVPSKTCTTTSVASLAVPENDGSVLFDGVAG